MSRMNELTRGIFVAVLLAALTGIEYFAGTHLPTAVALLVVFALLKAGLVVGYFMHVVRVFRSGGAGGHE